MDKKGINPSSSISSNNSKSDLALLITSITSFSFFKESSSSASTPAGQPQIEVKFEIDADGILNVSAEEKQSGENSSITIEDQARLDEDEIEEMKEEAD